MNVTTGGVEPPFAPNTSKAAGSDAYIFVVGFFCTVVLLISLTYTSYICRRTHSTPPPSISFGTTIYDEGDNHHLIRFSRGLDDEVLVTFPTLLYSEVKGDTTAKDANGSECSICLADYKPADVVRLLPECRHLFHVKCIDTWLKAHPTCPMCRKTPLANTVTL